MTASYGVLLLSRKEIATPQASTAESPYKHTIPNVTVWSTMLRILLLRARLICVAAHCRFRVSVRCSGGKGRLDDGMEPYLRPMDSHLQPWPNHSWQEGLNRSTAAVKQEPGMSLG